jgi:hypothetical protein
MTKILPASDKRYPAGDVREKIAGLSFILFASN